MRYLNPVAPHRCFSNLTGLIEQFSASVHTVIDFQCEYDVTFIQYSGPVTVLSIRSVIKRNVTTRHSLNKLEIFLFLQHLRVKSCKGNVMKKVNKSNINIQRFPSVESSSKLHYPMFKRFIYTSIVIGIIGFAYNRFWLNGGSGKCLISMPDSLSHAFRRPEDCSFCRNISKVDRVSNISPEEFEKRYAYNAKPVVITDATINWTALDVFDFWYFKEVYDSSDSDQMNCQFFPVRLFEFNGNFQLYRFFRSNFHLGFIFLPLSLINFFSHSFLYSSIFFIHPFFSIKFSVQNRIQISSRCLEHSTRTSELRAWNKTVVFWLE